MPGVTESDVVRFFHQSRVERAQRHLPGTDRLIAAIEQRAMREYGEYAEAEIKARRYFYERSLE
jgi:hypothetical protein